MSAGRGRRLLAIGVTTIVFGLVGPGIGGLVVLLPHGDVSFKLFVLAYAFGIVPALVAGVVYGVVRLRRADAAFPWHARALWGARAGLIGSLVFVVLGGTFTLVTAGTSTLRSEVDLYGQMIVAGVLAGVACALLVGRAATVNRCDCV